MDPNILHGINSKFYWNFLWYLCNLTLINLKLKLMVNYPCSDSLLGHDFWIFEHFGKRFYHCFDQNSVDEKWKKALSWGQQCSNSKDRRDKTPKKTALSQRSGKEIAAQTSGRFRQFLKGKIRLIERLKWATTANLRLLNIEIGK